jgi:cytochrome b6-f complex iron-sulfur subunit
MNNEKDANQKIDSKKSCEKTEMNRREFLNGLVLAAFGIATVGSVIVSYNYLSPNTLFEPPTNFRVGKPDLYPINSVTYIQDQQVYIVRTTEGLFAVSAVCTHLGCITQWKEESKMIACPCHGSNFKFNGSKIEGPAPRPLTHFSITLTADGELLVDKLITVQSDQVLKV